MVVVAASRARVVFVLEPKLLARVRTAVEEVCHGLRVLHTVNRKQLRAAVTLARVKPRPVLRV